MPNPVEKGQMSEKIEWYQEVLSLEPGSRVFFPLAKLFVENGQPEDAVKTLQQGLDRHPDFLEARMLLVELLTELEREDQVHEQLARVINPLRDYPAFWRGWARSLSPEERDLAVFLMLVSSNLSGDTIKWTDVVFEGIGTLADRLVGAPLPPPSETKPFSLPRVEKSFRGGERGRGISSGCRFFPHQDHGRPSCLPGRCGRCA